MTTFPDPHYVPSALTMLSGMTLLAAACCLPILLGLPRFAAWNAFALRKKWSARTILFILTVCLTFPYALYMPVLSIVLPGITVRPEVPSILALSIKDGLYEIVFAHQLKAQLPESQQSLVDCVLQISVENAARFQKSCQQKCSENSPSCALAIPPMSKEAIAAQIEKSQRQNIGRVSQACKGIDGAKL